MILKARKWFERFREIPEWIDAEMRCQVVSPKTVMAQLEAMRDVPDRPRLGMNALSQHLKSLRKARVVQGLSQTVVGPVLGLSVLVS